MAWISFLLGRPGLEYTFDVNPMAMDLSIANIEALQYNLAGDLKQSIIKVRVPTIKVSSNYLTLLQRNQFDSLVGVPDTFLSFQTRNDWEVVDELVTVLSTTSIKLSNNSATRLSKILVDLGFASIITIETPWKLGVNAGSLYGEGGYGDGGYGSSGEPFDPGTVTYDDVTRIATFTNPLADITTPLLVSYLYTGWLVKLKNFSHKVQGGWLDRFQYDFELTGA